MTSLMTLPNRKTVPMSVRIFATVRGDNGFWLPLCTDAFTPGCVRSLVLKAISASASISRSRQLPNSGKR